MSQIKLSVTYANNCPVPQDFIPTLTEVVLPKTHEIPSSGRPAVIICPGGGYDYCSDREAEPVAMRFAGYGIQSFVLRYSTGTGRTPFPTALCELAAAVAYVRSHAEEYQIDPNRITVCGFSAGAHLAASLAVHWHRPFLRELYQNDLHRPNSQLLGYPVITGGSYRHDGSIFNLIGDDSSDLLGTVTLEEQVTAEAPPAFLWHTADDGCVPVQNTLLYAQALSAVGVSYELHIYPSGSHGLSLCDDTTAQGEWHLNPVCAGWFMLAVDWMKQQA